MNVNGIFRGERQGRICPAAQGFPKQIELPAYRVCLNVLHGAIAHYRDSHP